MTDVRPIVLAHLRASDAKLARAAEPVAEGSRSARTLLRSASTELRQAQFWMGSAFPHERALVGQARTDLAVLMDMPASKMRGVRVVPPNLLTRHPIPGYSVRVGPEQLATVRSSVTSAMQSVEGVGHLRLGRLAVGAGALALLGAGAGALLSRDR